MSKRIDTVIFDLGNVLIGWDPRNLYRQLIADEAQMEWFLREVCSSAWNEQQDAGRPWSEATALLRAQYPEHSDWIDAYHLRWEETLLGALDDSVALLAQLRARGVRLLALTNWSQETFPIAQQRFEFLQWFEGIVVSGEERLIKPDPAIYQRLLQRYAVAPATALYIDDSLRNVQAAEARLLQRYAVAPATALYIDDSLRNVQAAEALGLHGWWFQGAEGLRQRLVELQLLEAPGHEVSHG